MLIPTVPAMSPIRAITIIISSNVNPAWRLSVSIVHLRREVPQDACRRKTLVVFAARSGGGPRCQEGEAPGCRPDTRAAPASAAARARSAGVIASARLRYQALEPSLLEDLHRLVTDAHIRRYMMDGITHPRAWTAARIADSERLQAERGVGLWLARRADDGDLVGFCGFLGFTSREPELLYALVEAHAGQGYGLEMARAAIAEARRHPGFGVIRAGVDAVNSRSLRLLEKLGFQRRGAQPGAFGECLLLHLPSVVRLD